jgi:twitching motility protein PilI
MLTEANSLQEYFAIRLNELLFAFALPDIETVIRLHPQNICPIPGMASFWLGITNHNGSLLWVLDTKSLFNLNETEKYNKQQVTAIVLKHFIQETQRRCAFVVQDLEGIIAINYNEVQPHSFAEKSAFQNLCKGSAKQGNRAFYIFDSEAIFCKLHQ